MELSYLFLLAAEEPAPTPVSTGNPIADVFISYGVIGITVVVLAFLANKLIKREQDRADRLEEDLRKYHEVQADKIIPALVNASNAVASAQQLLEGVIAKTAEMVEVTADLKLSAAVLKALISDVKRSDK